VKTLWLKVVETGGARIYGLIMGTFALFVTARILGPEGQGTLVAAIAWVTLFAAFSGLSLGQVAQYRIQVRERESWLPDIFGALSFCALVLTVIGCFCGVAIYQLTEGLPFKGIPPSVLVIAFIMLPLLIWEQYTTYLLPAAGKLRDYNKAQFMGRTLWLLGTFSLVVFFGMGIPGALIAQISGQGLIALLCFAALRKTANYKVHVEKTEIRELLKGSAKLHLNTVGSFLLAQSTILMLNYFTGKAEVGCYQIAYQMITILIIIPQAVSIVLFSKMAEVGVNSVWPMQKRICLQVLGIIVLLSSVAYLVVPSLIRLLAGPEFEPSVKIFRYLLPIVLGMTFAQLMTSQWIGRGAFLPTTLATFFTAIANIAMNGIFIPKFGMMGAVWTSLICYAGVTVVVQAYFAWWCEKKFRESQTK
jgi:O-antigen/teichoic acid export membrane protein